MIENPEMREFLSQFEAADVPMQEAVITRAMQAAQPEALKGAIESPAGSRAVADAGGPFVGVTPVDRAALYRLVLAILAGLAFVALAGGTAALLTGKESAAFFTFAGLALGGITGILVPSPTGSGSGG